MFSFSKKKQTENEIICVSVITSYSITSSIVRLFKSENNANARPVVLFSCEEILPTYHNREASRLLDIVLFHLKKTLEQCRSFGGNVDRLICTLGEPWVFTRARLIHLEKMDSFPVTQKIVDEMIARDLKLFEQEILADFGNENGMSLVGTSKPRVELNGYYADSIMGQPARIVDIHTSFSLARSSVVETVAGVYADVFHRDDVVFQSVDSAHVSIIPRDANQTMIHIGGLTTQISIISRGRLMQSAQIPSGLHDLEFGIMEEFGVPQISYSFSHEFFG